MSVSKDGRHIILTTITYLPFMGERERERVREREGGGKTELEREREGGRERDLE